jgi:cytochrome c5
MIAKGRFLALAVTGAAVWSALAHAQSPAPQSAPQPAETPEQAQDRQYVETTCAACHPIVQVMAKRMKPEDWAATVDKMIGMGAQVASEKDRDRIVAWLAAHQGPQ